MSGGVFLRCLGDRFGGLLLVWFVLFVGLVWLLGLVGRVG